MSNLFTLNKTSRLRQIIGDEWARHHFETRQLTERQSEINSDSDELDVTDFIEQSNTFYPSLSMEDLNQRLNKKPFSAAITYL